MELRVLQYFLAVAREQSISAAAESLHLSQPTLSTQLKALEEELGKRLLIRGTRGSRRVTLTEEGMILRKRAEEILELVRKAESEVSLSDGAVAGEVHIGAGETQSLRLLAKAAGSLKKRCPDVHYNISSGNAAYVTEQLDRGLIDFGLIFGPVDAAKYEAIALPGRDVWGVLMRRDQPLAEKESVSPEDLWDKPLIISAQKDGSWPVFAWLRRDVSRLNIVATYNLVFNASLLTSEGLGYTLCFDRLVSADERSGLCFRPFSPRLEAEAALIWRKYQLMSRPAARFLEELRRVLELGES